MNKRNYNKYLMAQAAISYRLLELEREAKTMKDPKSVQDYYPADPFEGLTDEEINAIISREEDFFEEMIGMCPNCDFYSVEREKVDTSKPYWWRGEDDIWKQ